MGTTNHWQKGSTRWRARELHSDSIGEVLSRAHTTRSDMWSFGMVIHVRPRFSSINHGLREPIAANLQELLTNSLPYDRLKDDEVSSAVSQGRLPEKPDFLHYSDNVRVVFRVLRSLALKCWHYDPSKRPSADTILSEVEFILRGFNTDGMCLVVRLFNGVKTKFRV